MGTGIETSIAANARDGEITATVSLYPGSQRRVLVNCAALLWQHELLVRSHDGYASPGISITNARAVMGGTVAEVLLDVAPEAQDKSFIAVQMVTNLGTFDLVVAVRVLGLGADEKPTQTYPLKGQ